MSKLLEKIRRDRFLLLTNFTFFLVLLLAYVTVIGKYFSPEYNKMGFELTYFSNKKLLIVFLLSSFFFVGTFIKDNFLKTCWNILCMYLLHPSLIYYLFNDATIGIVLKDIILLTLIFLIDKIPNPLNRGPLLQTKINPNKVLIGLTILLSLPFLTYLNDIDLSNLLLKNIYETRLKFREIDIPLLGYLISPISRVLIPILLITYLIKKRYFIVLLLLTLLTYIFLCGAVKSIILGGAATLFFYFGKEYKDKVYYFAFAFIAINIIGILSVYLIDNILIIDILTRRVFFVPPFLDNAYFEFFKGNYTYWSHLGFTDPTHQFGESVSRFVGEKVLGESNLNANVGVLTEGFFSFGWIGVVLHSLFYAAVLWLIKCLRVSSRYFGVFFIYLYVFNTSFLTTMTLTHALLFMLLIVAFFKKDTEGEHYA